MLKVKRLTETAKLPTYGSKGAAAFDFYSSGPSFIIHIDDFQIASTGLSVEIPPGKVLKIYSRSGDGFGDNVKLANSVGVIDSDYRGEIKVALHNAGDNNFEVKLGNRIAQGILEDAPQIEIVEVDELSETERGSGGFGSTGK